MVEQSFLQSWIWARKPPESSLLSLFPFLLSKNKFLNYKENHLTDIRKYDPEDGSHGKRMSKYVGKLKADNIPYDISWSIVTRASTYSPITKSCRLCLLEKYFIMYEPTGATLNVKSEFFSSCLHKRKLLLKNWDKPGWKGKLCKQISPFRFLCCNYEVNISYHYLCIK